MGFFDEMKKLVRPYADDEDDYDEYDDYEDDVEDEYDYEEPERTPARGARSTTRRSTATAAAAPVAPTFSAGTGMDARRPNGAKVVNINATAQLQVVIVKPERFDNVSEVADHLLEKHAVLLNLESTEKNTARRLVDFLSGCAYALNGKIKKVAASTYLITPINVEIVGDLVEELENSGMYL